MLLIGCKPELPVTSSINIDMDVLGYAVNKDLYGLNIEEINHAIEGGIYAELIQNRNFEDGTLPLHCSYDASRKLLRTPNGGTLPFLPPDSIPGWKLLAANTYITIDNKRPVNDKNPRSLMVSVYTNETIGRGGVIAEGYKGIPIRKGEKYNLSFYTRTSSTVIPRTLKIALEDSLAKNILSNVYQVKPTFEWEHHQFTFTAKDDADNALLTFASDSSTFFWLDAVSLFPEKTWKNRKNGLRPELMEMIEAMNPAFIRFPGGEFVEGYTLGTYPIWKESIGNINERKHFWNIWSYGSSNGMGYHEFLEMCEDLQTEPVYVVNAGITHQGMRPRYEDITQMPNLAEEALAAIAYANDPPHTPYGSMRAENGHPEPFNLKHIEIGNGNSGYEYARRFEYFRKAIHDTYPDITIISSSPLNKHPYGVWADHHYYANATYFLTNHYRFNSRVYPRTYPNMFIGEFSTVDNKDAGTLWAAVAEACFLIGIEQYPEKIKRLAYAPVFGNVNYEIKRFPLISFTNSQIAASPSYYLFQLFNKYRGDNVLKTEVDTYHKPQVTFGKTGIELSDNNFEIKNVRFDNEPVISEIVLDKNNQNSFTFGDSTSYNYSLSFDVKRTKGNGEILLYARSNEQPEDLQNYIGMSLGGRMSELYQQSGLMKDSLTSPKPFQIDNEAWYNVRMSCLNDTIRFYVNSFLLHEAILAPLPSLVTLATYDEANKMIIVKVVNTTAHEEKTELNIRGASVKSQARVIQLTGSPNARNTFENPTKIIPNEKEISFPLGLGMVYSFPPNSITVMKLFVN